MLINMNNILKEADQKRQAIAHFNINNLEWTKYILEVAQEEQVPIILGVSESAIKYMGGYQVVSSFVNALIRDLSIQIHVVLHLDHGKSFESCKKAIDAGFTSVMIDGSSYPLEKNIEITKTVCKYAKEKNISVEAELGSLDAAQKTNIEDIITFIQNVDIDALAPSVGNAHGLYKGEVKLDISLINKIKEVTHLPLVLHGGTGIPDNQIKESIQNGICKINVNTELQVAWSNGVRKYLSENEQVYDPRKIISSGERSLKEKVREKIKTFKNNNI